MKRGRATTKKIEENGDLLGFTDLSLADRTLLNQLIDAFVATNIVGSGAGTKVKKHAAIASPAPEMTPSFFMGGKRPANAFAALKPFCSIDRMPPVAIQPPATARVAAIGPTATYGLPDNAFVVFTALCDKISAPWPISTRHPFYVIS